MHIALLSGRLRERKRDVFIYSSPLLQSGYHTSSIFKWSIAGSNSEFSSPRLVAYRTQFQLLSTHSWKENRWINAFYERHLPKRKCKQTCRGFELKLPILFPIIITIMLSKKDMYTSYCFVLLVYIYIYIYIYLCVYVCVCICMKVCI